MSSSLTGKFIANTFQRLFQRSGAPLANGYESVSFTAALTNDSLTLLNGLGEKIKGFIFDRGVAGGDGGIYIQTESMKSSSDFGLRLDVSNERGNITSKNKDILISTDNSTPNDILEDRRRLILKGGLPGSMSSTSDASQLNGGVNGEQNQLTLQVQGRLSVEHTTPIVLDVSLDGIEELALVSGIYTDGSQYQMWQKVGNIVSVSGVWQTDSTTGEIPVPIITNNATETNIIRAYGVGDYQSGSCFVSPVVSPASSTNVILNDSGGGFPVLDEFVSISYSYVLEF
jgi:hypothetical protein